MTTVRFPTRVRVTVTDVDADDLVSMALDATDVALTRAVRRAGGLHLVRDTAPSPGRRPLIDVRLTGDTLPAHLEERLVRELTALAVARSAQLLATPGSRSMAPRPSAAEGETYDAHRVLLDPHASLEDAYLIAAYDSGGAPVAVPVTGPGHGQAAAHTSTARRVHRRLVEVETRGQLEGLVRDRFGDDAPPRFVALYRVRGHSIMVLMHCQPSGTVTNALLMGETASYASPTGSHAGRWQQTSILDVDEIEYAGYAATDEARLRARTTTWLAHLRNSGSAEGVSDDDLRHQAARLAATMPHVDGMTSYYWIGAGGSAEIMEVQAAPAFDGALPVVAFVETYETEAAAGEVGDSAGDDETYPALPLEELLLFDPDVSRPFLAEPPVEFWPAGISAQLSRLISRIATILAMPEGSYPGMFLLAAFQRIGVIGERTGRLAGTGQPGESPRFAHVRTMVTAYEPIAELEQLYTRVIAASDEGRTAPAPIRHNSASWLLHFYEQFFTRRDSSVRVLFVATCQDQLLDVLESSHLQIVQRQQNFAAYMRITRWLVLLLLVDDTELSELRRILVDRIQRERADIVGAVVGATEMDRWWLSTSVVLSSMGRLDADETPPGTRGATRRAADGWQVQDSTGRWWSRGDLESVITGGRQAAYSVDPMLEKLADLDDVIARLRTAGASGIDEEFRSLLEELRRENVSKTQDVRDDVNIAFGLAGIREAEITTASSIGGELSGIHRLADDALRPLFTGESGEVYTIGMRTLVSTELGKSAFMEFFNIVGLTALAIVFPPAAFVIGAIEAIDAVDTALEHRGIQRAMLGGDAIITHASAEAELWGAAIGAALVFVPEVPGLLRGASRGVGAVVRGEVREAASVAGRELAESAARHIAELAAKDLLRAFATECLKGYLLNLAINGAIGRLTDAVAREVAATGHASVLDLPQLIGDAVTGPPTVSR